MAKVKFTAGCIASYYSELEIPDSIKDNKYEVLDYIREYIDDAPVIDLEFLNDFEGDESVEYDDIISIEP